MTELKEYFFDINYKSINKHTEELCGDKVKYLYDDDGIIIVLSDGLGSSVKAHFLNARLEN